jgi:hypothetical protein
MSKIKNFFRQLKIEAQTLILGTCNKRHKSDKSKLDLNEYHMKEMNKPKEDLTDKVKPYDNLEAKIYHPELKEQYEKRKDMFNTLDTPYIKEENKKI